ncbi:hypothetical protein FSP39_013371 [Pinctada imbricata]|uniref:Tyr recombinase domain-containing protein n=1 Tax=Pinctada imbricata TaxID=66713 RepID=A0AA88YLK9_PINIB|nr:hypothetical protein FSP39_013371 [Pinctada imbricata]
MASDDSSSNSSSSHTTRPKKYPTTASNWKLSHLEDIGICYDTKPSTLQDFFTFLRSTEVIESNGFSELPPISKTLIQLSSELWTVSYDFQDDLFKGVRSKLKEVDDLKAEVMETEGDLKRKVKEYVGVKEDKVERLFNGWSWNMIEFWNCVGDLLARYKMAEQRDGRFTFLLMAFSRLFFLRPESGDLYPAELYIKDVIVHGTPAVRFIMRNKKKIDENGLELFIVTKVKNYNVFRGEFTPDTFTSENISKNVRGQHGITLVMERYASLFFPGVVGVLCIGTKIIFTYLELSASHFDEIRIRGTVDERHKASIKTDPQAQKLFNQYNADAPVSTTFWFTAKPLSQRTFSNFMPDISKSANTNVHYTNHCVRATAIQYLNDADVEARHIMFVSYHTSESSIRSYNRTVSQEQKRRLSATLSSALGEELSVVPLQSTQDPNTAITTPRPPLFPIENAASQPRDRGSSTNTCSTYQQSNNGHSMAFDVRAFNHSSGFLSNSVFNNCNFSFGK